MRPFFSNTDKMPIGFQDAYECPLCMTIHEESSLFVDPKEDDFLSLEDAPPKSLGGRPVCLTCRKCNNDTGGTIDRDVKRFQVMKSVLLKDPEERIDVTILVGDCLRSRGHLGWSLKGDRLELQSRTDRFSFAKLSKIAANERTQFKLEFKKPKDRSVNIALLKTAYLLAFAKFGYAYIQNRALDRVREQILNHSRQVIPVGVIHPSDKNFPDGFYKITQPEDMQSLLVVFSIKGSKTRTEKVAIILPSVVDSKSTIYSKLKSGVVSFQLGNSQRILFLTDEIRLLDPFLIWMRFDD